MFPSTVVVRRTIAYQPPAAISVFFQRFSTPKKGGTLNESDLFPDDLVENLPVDASLGEASRALSVVDWPDEGGGGCTRYRIGEMYSISCMAVVV